MHASEEETLVPCIAFCAFYSKNYSGIMNSSAALAIGVSFFLFVKHYLVLVLMLLISLLYSDDVG